MKNTKNTRGLLSLLLVLGVGCTESASEVAPSEDENDELVSKSADVKALDAMVDEINGYRSIDDYVEIAPKAYPTDIRIDWKANCSVDDNFRESGARGFRRASKTGKIRQLEFDWTNYGTKTREEVAESAIYDAAGRLRVTVFDVEIDHSADDAYVAKTLARGRAIQKQLRALAASPDGHRAAIDKANLLDEAPNMLTIEQRRIYYDTAGRVVQETVRMGLEHNYMAAASRWVRDEVPPQVYDSGRHPSAAKNRFRYEAIIPQVLVLPTELPEYTVPAAKSWRSRALIQPGSDPERELVRPIVCRR